VNGKWQGGRVVAAPLLKYVLQSGERVVKVDSAGKISQTHFKTLKSFREATLLEAMPLTGRTHQIRVHCTFMGHPIVGDLKYGDSQNRPRLFLHAHKLEIQVPYSPFQLSVSCPLPIEFENYLTYLT